jgi:aminodeoxyfutalosine deaminase
LNRYTAPNQQETRPWPVRYRAAWVLPIATAPIRDGWVEADSGRVTAVGGGLASDGGREIDLGNVALMPGLVNAHTHLELSFLRGHVPPASAFVTWIRSIIWARRERPDPRAPEILVAVDRGIVESAQSGTAVVGDISNSLVTFAPLAASALAGVVFYELIGFNAQDPEGIVAAARRDVDRLGSADRVRASLAAHAPYSVAPALFRAIRDAVGRDGATPCSVHLSESPEETEFIRTGGGPWRVLLDDMRAWDPNWIAPGGSPVEYLDAQGFLDDRLLAVHGVQMSRSDLARLVSRGTTLVTCPRSNVHTGAGAPPIAEFYASGVRVAVGTDSLASAPDLNVFAELATMRALAPEVPASALLDSATRQGARALGFDADYGTIAPGKSGRLLAVTLPAATDDVEEYLVRGIQADQIRWLDSLT